MELAARVERLEATVRALQGEVRRGTGSPEGVVDAAVGVKWVDESSGDWYRKTTPLGTLTGWVLV